MVPVGEIRDDMQADLERAVRILKEMGAKHVYLFGSVLTGTSSSTSDIDMAVEGLNPRRYFAAHGRLAMELQHDFDLVDLDVDSAFVQTLKRNGPLERVA